MQPAEPNDALVDALLRNLDPIALVVVGAAVLGVVALLMEWGIGAWLEWRERRMWREREGER